MPGTYDPELDTLYWTTSNAAPDFVGDSRPGDDLYTACVLAIDANTGKLKWYFQFTPHDVYDYDANETPVLVDEEENGAVRHLLFQADRNGFFYVLDRTNGKFLRATPFAGKVELGYRNRCLRSSRLSGRVPTKEGTHICPGIVGATNWFSPSYNPNTGLFYVMALESCKRLFRESRSRSLQARLTTAPELSFPPVKHSQKVLLALKPSDGKEAWRYPQAGRGNSWGGTLATAGGLVFCRRCRIPGSSRRRNGTGSVALQHGSII